MKRFDPAAQLAMYLGVMLRRERAPKPRAVFGRGGPPKRSLGHWLRMNGSRYRPHQGGWECQRRVLQARGAWPRRFEVGDVVRVHIPGGGVEPLSGQVTDVYRGGNQHVVRLFPDSIKRVGVDDVLVPKRQLELHR